MRNFYDDPAWYEFADPDGHDELEFERVGLTLSLEQQAALSAAVEAQLRAQPCDGTLRGAQQWADGAGVEWSLLQRELEENGGYCDCEVLLNVFGGDFDGLGRDDGFEPD